MPYSVTSQVTKLSAIRYLSVVVVNDCAHHTYSFTKVCAIRPTRLICIPMNPLGLFKCIVTDRDIPRSYLPTAKRVTDLQIEEYLGYLRLKLHSKIRKLTNDSCALTPVSSHSSQRADVSLTGDSGGLRGFKELEADTQDYLLGTPPGQGAGCAMLDSPSSGLHPVEAGSCVVTDANPHAVVGLGSTAGLSAVPCDGAPPPVDYASLLAGVNSL